MEDLKNLVKDEIVVKTTNFLHKLVTITRTCVEIPCYCDDPDYKCYMGTCYYRYCPYGTKEDPNNKNRCIATLFAC